jgi:hypothetical protein
MRIEESFRDLKTGLNFTDNNTPTLEYLSVLLLLEMFRQYVLFLLGMVVEQRKQCHSYQANSVKIGSVLSYKFIGVRAFRDRHLILKQ